MKSTLSDCTSFSVFCLPTSGFWPSSPDHLDRLAAHLAPEMIERQLDELRMSLPITAVGPLKVETNPILMESAAIAGVASQSRRTRQPECRFHIYLPSHYFSPPAKRLP
jgi:hypothetical protein